MDLADLPNPTAGAPAVPMLADAALADAALAGNATEALAGRNAQRLLADVRAIADGPLREAAPAIDRGTYPRQILQQLGAAGAYAAHLGPGAQAGDFWLAIQARGRGVRACAAPPASWSGASRSAASTCSSPATRR